MTDYELKKLKRGELLELLVAQGKENEALKAKLQQATDALKSREIATENAGSIAEASLQLNGVFEAAQKAADQYLENIRRLSGEQERICARMEAESREKTDRQLVQTEQMCQQMEADTQKRCEKMLADAKQESEAYWQDISKRLEDFYQAHAGLQELLAIRGKRNIEE